MMLRVLHQTPAAFFIRPGCDVRVARPFSGCNTLTDFQTATFAKKRDFAEYKKRLEIDWFPMNVSDLNLIGSKLMDLGQGGNSDHPVYTDTMYRKRREEIRRLSIGHKVGGRINHVNYSKSEHKLWEHIYKSARHMQEEMYCEQYIESIHKLESSKVFRPDKDPELEDLDAWVNEVSGWHLKPVGGMLSQREFLNCLAFKVFCSGQHLRHPERPDYSPEPDIMHEYLGHIPSFAEPGLCEIAQQLGALSLGATDQQ